MIRRREFVAGLGSAVAWPVVVRAQQAAMPVIGFLNVGSADGYASQVVAFRQGLKETGTSKQELKDRIVAAMDHFNQDCWKRWSSQWLYQDLKLFNSYRVRRPPTKVAP